MKNITLVFSSYQEFLDREDKTVNGVSPRFARMYPNFSKMNETNIGCYNCLNCSQCFNCSECTRCVSCSGSFLLVSCVFCFDCSLSENLQDCELCKLCESCTFCYGLKHEKDKKDIFTNDSFHALVNKS